jgi:hypothetical protein
LVPLPEREAFGCGANPLYSVVDAQVPEPDRAIALLLASVCRDSEAGRRLLPMHRLHTPRVGSTE